MPCRMVLTLLMHTCRAQQLCNMSACACGAALRNCAASVSLTASGTFSCAQQIAALSRQAVHISLEPSSAAAQNIEPGFLQMTLRLWHGRSARAHQVSLRDSDVLLPRTLAVACSPACSTPSTIRGCNGVASYRCVKHVRHDRGCNQEPSWPCVKHAQYSRGLRSRALMALREAYAVARGLRAGTPDSAVKRPASSSKQLHGPSCA